MNLVARILVSAALTLFFGAPLTRPFGDNPYGPLIQLERTHDQGPIRRPGVSRIELYADEVYEPFFSEITLGIDSVPVNFHWEVVGRQHGEATLIATPADGPRFPEGGWLEIDAPFTIHFRPLYPFSPREILGRIVLWPPFAFSIFILPALFAFCYLSTCAIGFLGRPEADSLRS